MKESYDWRQPPIDFVAPERVGSHTEQKLAKTSIMSDNGLFDYNQALCCELTAQSGLVLDIGTGRNARFLHEARRKGIIAVGIAPFQTPEGRPNIPADMPETKRPHLIQATASALPFADEQFDTCISLHTISYIVPFVDQSTRAQIYAELMRVLRPGGSAYLGRFTPKELELATPLIDPLRQMGAEVRSYRSKKFVNRVNRRNVYADRYTVHIHKPPAQSV